MKYTEGTTRTNKLWCTDCGDRIPKADVKIKCAREGKTIRQVIEELLKDRVKQ